MILWFSTDEGKAIQRTRFSDVWRPAAKAAGLEAGTGMHALRHFYASALIHHGESVKVVQDRLGHATAAETLDTYSHLWPDSEDKTRDAVEAVLGGVGLTWGQRAAEIDAKVSGWVTMSRPVGGVLFPGPLRGSGSVTIHLCGAPEGSS